MDAADLERIASRVRKLERLAKDKGATPGERDNAARMAKATRKKYNIGYRAPVRSPAFDTPQEMQSLQPHRARVAFLKTVELTEWEARFINSIADRLDCDSFLTKGQAEKLHDVWFNHRESKSQ